MVCKQCGGSIPEGGKFCPECGAPVSLKATAIKKPSKAAHTARPLADNPFQPRATYKKPAAKDPIALDAMDDAADAEDVLVEESTPIPAAPRPKPRTGARKAPQSVDLDTADAVDVEDVEDVASDETDADGALTSAPQKKRPRPANSISAVHASSPRSGGKKEEDDAKEAAQSYAPRPRPRKRPHSIPEESAEHAPPRATAAQEARETADAISPQIGANRASIAPAPPASRKVNTMVPKRKSPEELEMDEFFDDDEDDDLEEGGVQSFFERNLRGIITLGLLAVTFLVLICWLTLSSSGKIFVAGLGITQDAQAYKLLGDQFAENGQAKSASDAYHRALTYDPDNYDYAMLCADAFYALQDKELAAKAAQLAISLKPEERAPYDLLKEMFPANARPANIAGILADGAILFNDPTLAQ